LVKKYQIKKARCEQHAFSNKLYNGCYKMAVITAELNSPRHDQIYNILTFMKAKLWINFIKTRNCDIFSFSA
jgi:hypothetical protein